MARILLIDPDQNLSATIAESLKRAGHIVEISESAQSAIHSVDKFKPELIILELQMRTHNGIEFLYELRSYDDCQNLPVIIHSFISPTQQAISPMLWKQLNIKDYLYKPSAKLADLSARVEDVLILAR